MRSQHASDGPAARQRVKGSQDTAGATNPQSRQDNYTITVTSNGESEYNYTEGANEYSYIEGGG